MKYSKTGPVFWTSATLVVLLVSAGMIWVGWNHFRVTDQQTATAPAQPEAPKPPITPSLDVPSTITVLVVCSYAIDRVLRGLLFLLNLSPAWRKRFPNPATLPDPAKEPSAVTAAEARENLERANVRQKLAYFVPAFLAGIFLATFGHIRLLQFMGFQFHNEEISGGLVDIIVTALVLMGGADQTSQILDRFGTKISVPRDQSERKPVELTGTLIIEGPAGSLLAGNKVETKSAA